jgi:hypothetical protein
MLIYGSKTLAGIKLSCKVLKHEFSTGSGGDWLFEGQNLASKHIDINVKTHPQTLTHRACHGALQMHFLGKKE